MNIYNSYWKWPENLINGRNKVEEKMITGGACSGLGGNTDQGEWFIKPTHPATMEE